MSADASLAASLAFSTVCEVAQLLRCMSLFLVNVKTVKTLKSPKARIYSPRQPALVAWNTYQ